MIFDSFMIPDDMVKDLTIVIDSCNEIRPVQVQEGPDKGAFFLDADILNRFPQLEEKLGKDKLPATIIKKSLDSIAIRKDISKDKLDKEKL